MHTLSLSLLHEHTCKNCNRLWHTYFFFFLYSYSNKIAWVGIGFFSIVKFKSKKCVCVCVRVGQCICMRMTGNRFMRKNLHTWGGLTNWMVLSINNNNPYFCSYITRNRRFSLCVNLVFFFSSFLYSQMIYAYWKEVTSVEKCLLYSRL